MHLGICRRHFLLRNPTGKAATNILLILLLSHGKTAILLRLQLLYKLYHVLLFVAAENFPARPENALNTSVRGIHSNGTNVSDEVGEWELTEVDFPHIFDLFTVRLILFTLYSLVFIVCVVGKPSVSKVVYFDII